MYSGERLGQAIREALKLKGVSQTRLAADFGVKPPSVQDWLNKGTIAKEKLPKLWEYFADVVQADHWGLESAPSFLTAEEPDATDESEFACVRRYDVRLSNGHGVGLEAVEELPGLTFRLDFLHSIGLTKKNAVVVGSVGDSNVPTIPDGQGMVLVKLDKETIANGKLHAFRLGRDLLIKRLHRLKDGTIIATPDNPKYPTIIIDKTQRDDFQLLGRAYWHCSVLD